MPTSTALIAQVEEALATPRVLDRDLVQNLLDLAKALETALINACQENLQLKTMDQNVAAAADVLKTSIEQLQSSFNQPTDVEWTQVDSLVETQLNNAKTQLKG